MLSRPEYALCVDYQSLFVPYQPAYACNDHECMLLVILGSCTGLDRTHSYDCALLAPAYKFQWHVA